MESRPAPKLDSLLKYVRKSANHTKNGAQLHIYLLKNRWPGDGLEITRGEARHEQKGEKQARKSATSMQLAATGNRVFKTEPESGSHPGIAPTQGRINTRGRFAPC